MSTPDPNLTPPRRPRIRLPFEKSRTDVGEWAYDHRVGLCITLIVYLVLLAAGMILIRPVWGSLAFVGALLIFWYYHHIAMKYFGGTTGDISGFFLCICEVGMALILAVVSNF